MEVAANFRVKGTAVSGTLHLPGEPVKAPAVVMCHGFTGNKLEAHFIFVKTARALAAAGIAAYRFDFRGSGESGGTFEQMTIPGEILDARAALSFIARQPRIDSRRLGLLGLSLGGMVAANAAAREKTVRSLALWCPVGDPARSLKTVLEWGGTGRREGKVYDIGGLGLGPGFFRPVKNINPVEALRKCRRPFPVLLVKGEADGTISMDEHNLYVQALRDATHPLKQVVIPGAGHTFERLDHEREAIRTTVDWFRKTL
jgi:dipeptidyl aminopeptidase/acylaminoacyl peptidase